jgi:hypothetical protein
MAGCRRPAQGEIHDPCASQVHPGTDGFIGDLTSQFVAVLAHDNRNGAAADTNAHPHLLSSSGPLHLALRARAPAPDDLGNTMASARAVADACGFYEGEVQQ